MNQIVNERKSLECQEYLSFPNKCSLTLSTIINNMFTQNESYSIDESSGLAGKTWESPD